MPHLIFFDLIRFDTKWKLYLCRATKNNRVAEFVLPLVFKTRNLSEKCENIAIFCLQQYFVIGFVQKSSVQICLTIKSAFKKMGKRFFWFHLDKRCAKNLHQLNKYKTFASNAQRRRFSHKEQGRIRFEDANFIPSCFTNTHSLIIALFVFIQILAQNIHS